MPKEEKTYSESEVAQQLEAHHLPAWEYKDGWIRREYKTPGWSHTMMAVNAVAFLAEAAGHHPDLNVSYGHFTVKLATHSAKGITEKDFALAKMIEGHLTWLPTDHSPHDGFETVMKKKWIR